MEIHGQPEPHRFLTTDTPLPYPILNFPPLNTQYLILNTAYSPNHNAISTAAFSGESEPWMRLLSRSQV